MADDARESGRPGSHPADEAALSARLRRLGDQLEHVAPSRAPNKGPGPAGDPSAMARGFRLSAELVGGVVVGAMIGWLLDRWLGISPWGLIVFLLFGFAAGVLNVIRSAGVAPTPTTPGEDRRNN